MSKQQDIAQEIVYDAREIWMNSHPDVEDEAGAVHTAAKALRTASQRGAKRRRLDDLEGDVRTALKDLTAAYQNIGVEPTRQDHLEDKLDAFRDTIL